MEYMVSVTTKCLMTFRSICCDTHCTTCTVLLNEKRCWPWPYTSVSTVSITALVTTARRVLRQVNSTESTCPGPEGSSCYSKTERSTFFLACFFLVFFLAFFLAFFLSLPSCARPTGPRCDAAVLRRCCRLQPWLMAACPGDGAAGGVRRAEAEHPRSSATHTTADSRALQLAQTLARTLFQLVLVMLIQDTLLHRRPATLAWPIRYAHF